MPMNLSLGLGLGGIPVSEGVGGFSLDAYMASLSDGLYFDATRTDRFFQENTGPTLADDVGEAMGLALDQRTWGGKTLAEVLAEQTELVTNGDASSLTGVTAVSSGVLTLAGGQFRLQNGAATESYAVFDSVVPTPGKLYAVTLTASAGVSVTVGSTRIGMGAGTSTEYIVAGDSAAFRIGSNNASSGYSVDFDNVSVKLVPGNHGVQATGTLKPTRQTSGAKFDGSDDNWLTPYLAGAGSNFVVALVTAPASVPAFQYIFGSTDGNRFGVGVNPDGTVGFAAGSTSPMTAKGTTDIRNVESVIGMSCDGANVLGFVDAAQEYASALAGSLNTTTPVRIGAINSSGTANSFYGGTIKKLVAGRDALTLARYQQIHNTLLTT
jgi:hypothetical protein